MAPGGASANPTRPPVSPPPISQATAPTTRTKAASGRLLHRLIIAQARVLFGDYTPHALALGQFADAVREVSDAYDPVRIVAFVLQAREAGRNREALLFHMLNGAEFPPADHALAAAKPLWLQYDRECAERNMAAVEEAAASGGDGNGDEEAEP